MNCEVGLGSTSDDENTPENVFAGGTWEQNNIINGEAVQGKILYFTENNFTLRHWSDFNGINYDYTYTGTYTLFYDDDNRENINFVSNEPTVNGGTFYSFAPIYNPAGIQIYPDNSVWFFNPNLLISGIYIKVAP
jgi:hypothetical protein